MSVIHVTDLQQSIAKLREDAINRLVSALNHDYSMQLRGEIRAYDEVVYKLIEEPRQEAERQSLNGANDD